MLSYLKDSVPTAAAVANFYLSHSDALYVRSGHTLDLLVRDAEKIRTEWLTGRKTTSISAKQAETRQNTVSVYDAIKQRLIETGDTKWIS